MYSGTRSATERNNLIQLQVQRLIKSISTVRFQVIFTMLSKGGAAGFGAVTAALIGSIGGASILGYYALVRVLPSIFVLLTELGISNSYPFLVQRLGYDSRRVYRSGVLAAIAVGIFQLLSWSALAGVIRDRFLADFAYYEVLIVGALAPLQVILLHATNLQRSIGRFKGANSVFVALEAAVILALLPALTQGHISTSYLVHGVIAAHAVIAISVVGYLSVEGYSYRPLFDWEILRRSVGFGARAQIGNAFQVLNYRIDQVMLGAMLGAEVLGPYVIAAKAAELFKFLGTSVVFVLEPVLASDSVDRAASLVKNKSSRLLIANAAIVVMGMISVPFFLRPVFGEWSTAALWPFLIISVGMIISGANGLYAAFNFSAGRPGWNTQVVILGFAVIVAGNLILVPEFGVIGAALAAAAMQAAVTIGFRARFSRSCASLVSNSPDL